MLERIVLYKWFEKVLTIRLFARNEWHDAQKKWIMARVVASRTNPRISLELLSADMLFCVVACISPLWTPHAQTHRWRICASLFSATSSLCQRRPCPNVYECWYSRQHLHNALGTVCHISGNVISSIPDQPLRPHTLSPGGVSCHSQPIEGRA